jgi:acyl-coenzyme A thioesterase PaaI-like protein
MLSTFVDILLSTAAQYQTDIPRVFLPTISLQMDFIAGAPLGSWVQGQADILRVTRNLIFSQALVHADGVLAMRASGVFKRGPLLPDSAGDQMLRLPGMPERQRSAA